MVEVVAPNAVQSVAAAIGRIGQAHVVLIGLGDDVHDPTLTCRNFLHGRLDVGEDVPRRKIVDRLHRIEPQAVDVEIAHPHAGVIDDELPHRVAVGTVVIDGFSPRRVIAIGEIRPKLGQVVSFRTEVVVNHVQNHRQAALMSGVDKPLERGGPAVTVLHGIGMDSVVAPIAIAGKLRNGHQFDGRHAQRG